MVAAISPTGGENSEFVYACVCIFMREKDGGEGAMVAAVQVTEDDATVRRRQGGGVQQCERRKRERCVCVCSIEIREKRE